MTFIQNYINPITDKIAQYIPSPIKTTFGSLSSRTVQFFASGSYGAIAGVTALNTFNAVLLGKIAVSFQKYLFKKNETLPVDFRLSHNVAALTAGAATFTLNEIFNKFTGFNNPYVNTRYANFLYSAITTAYVWIKLTAILAMKFPKIKASSESPSPNERLNTTRVETEDNDRDVSPMDDSEGKGNAQETETEEINSDETGPEGPELSSDEEPEYDKEVKLSSAIEVNESDLENINELFNIFPEFSMWKDIFISEYKTRVIYYKISVMEIEDLQNQHPEITPPTLHVNFEDIEYCDIDYLFKKVTSHDQENLDKFISLLIDIYDDIDEAQFILEKQLENLKEAVDEAEIRTNFDAIEFSKSLPSVDEETDGEEESRSVTVSAVSRFYGFGSSEATGGML